MRVFLTGATGFVGSAVVRELLDAGHRVVGLARSESAARALAAAGAEAHPGDLADLDALRAGASAADAAIHLGFVHDFANFGASCETDRRAILALGAALAGSDRPLLVTSAIGILPSGHLVTEDSRPAPGPAAHPRAATERAAEAAAAAGARVSLVRLPPSVHGAGDHGFVPTLIRLARDRGVAAYVGGGRNRWPAVHRDDAARLFRLALEAGRGGARYHAVAEEGVAFRDIAAAIGRGLDLPTLSKDGADAEAHFGWFARFAALDVLASSRRTRDALGWRPTGPTLLDDLPGYFAAP